MYGGFFKDVAREIGLEKAMALHAKQGRAMGAMMGEAACEQSRSGVPPLNALASASLNGNLEIGVVCEVEETSRAIRLWLFDCPFYEGLRSAGLNHETVEAMCTGVGNAIRAELERSNPEVEETFQFRPAADQPCREQFSTRT